MSGSEHHKTAQLGSHTLGCLSQLKAQQRSALSQDDAAQRQSAVVTGISTSYSFELNQSQIVVSSAFADASANSLRLNRIKSKTL
jgi:hypothetical protein